MARKKWETKAFSPADAKAGIELTGSGSYILKASGGACFEFALLTDPEAPFPKDARLVLEAKAAKTALPLSKGYDGGDGYLSFRFSGIRSGAKYRLSYVHQGRTETLFQDAVLSTLLDEADGGAATDPLAAVGPLFGSDDDDDGDGAGGDGKDDDLYKDLDADPEMVEDDEWPDDPPPQPADGGSD